MVRINKEKYLWYGKRIKTPRGYSIGNARKYDKTNQKYDMIEKYESKLK